MSTSVRASLCQRSAVNSTVCSIRSWTAFSGTVLLGSLLTCFDQQYITEVPPSILRAGLGGLHGKDSFVETCSVIPGWASLSEVGSTCWEDQPSC